MIPMPVGTVTFLFTDIEGSTRLWEVHPEEMRQALGRHDALLRKAVSHNNGHVFKTIGDAFCTAFHTAGEALNAALDAQLALNTEIWPELVVITVRMALHTGAAEVRDNDYFGQPLNRIARMLAAAHGGQVLLSDITGELCSGSLPPDTGLKTLGEHRLRDLEQQILLYQLVHPSLLVDFPPLRSLGAPEIRNNLPQQLTSFVGRKIELTEITERLLASHLLTLTGSGGCGKSRLCLQAAINSLQHFKDGVWLVELAPLTDAALVAHAVADVLGIREAPGEAITASIAAALKSKHSLLVLDNCEHVLQSSANLADALLKACPNLRILASSREAIGITGEVTYRVPSLSVPRPGSDCTPASISEFDAVRLFVDRAASANPNFAVTTQNATALASICHRLDGIPLAIELAAARLRAMPLEQIESRLDNRFRILTGGSRTALPRQQTLRALIDWSYDLLNRTEQLLLLRLSVFIGGWTLAAAETVCSGGEIDEFEVLDLLTSLVDKSLVVYEERRAGSRYRLLETVRQYASEHQAETGSSEELRDRHRDAYLVLAEEAAPNLEGGEQLEWLQKLEEDHENLRTALDWSLHGTRPVDGLRLCAALTNFWWMLGLFTEGREWCALALGREGCQARTRARANTLFAAGFLAWLQGDYAAAIPWQKESTEIGREIGDARCIGQSLFGQALVAFGLDDYKSARGPILESIQIARDTHDESLIAKTVYFHGILTRIEGDYAAAMRSYEESIAILRDIGDRFALSYPLYDMSYACYYQADYLTALPYAEESLAIRREICDRWGIAESLYGLALLAFAQNDFRLARTYFEESLTLGREIADKTRVAYSLNGLGLAACYQADLSSARTHHEESIAIKRENGDRWGIAQSIEALAYLHSCENRAERATTLWGAAESLREEISSPIQPGERERHDREVAETRSKLDETSFQHAWNIGRSLTWEQAVGLALQ